MGAKDVIISLPSQNSAKIVKWKVEEGTIVYEGRVLLLYDVKSKSQNNELKKLKATEVGTVRKLLVKEGEIVDGGVPLLELELGCSHPTVMNDLCAECGADLRRQDAVSAHASVPMVHSVPDLKVSEEQAQILGKADEERLLKDRKLVLLVDLDQTLIHTTNDNIPNNLKDVYHFQLYGPRSPWYHTRLRPGTQQFLTKISKFYELHICTFGARNYAHMIAHFLDPDGKFFSHRILSRDECFNPNSKMANLKALFPCGDEMVCIIDDREDVWNYAPNLIHVKPYHFFQHTGDIHAPPGLTKNENDEKEGFDFSQFAQGTSLKPKDALQVNEHTPKKKKDDSSESELEDGELRSKSKISFNNDEETQCKEIETKGDNLEMESKITVDEKISEHCNTSDDNKENATNEEKVTSSENGSEKEIAKTGSGIRLKTEKDIKENKQTSGKNGEIKVVEQAKLVNDIIEIEESDDYLMYLEEILEKIHKFFYEIHDSKREGDRDMKKVIPDVRKEVLSGTKLVFSGLVPTNQSLEQSRAYNIARSLGADVTQDLTKDCTHLVAVRTGTAKVNAGRRMKELKLVTPDWLWTCAERWERVEESLFPVGCERAGSRHPPPHCASPPHGGGTGGPAPRQRSPSGRFMDTINPLMTFSSEDIADMDAEVDDMCNESEDEQSDQEAAEEKATTSSKKTARKSPVGFGNDSSSSSADSLAGDHIRGWGRKRPREEGESDEEASVGDKFRRGEELPSDVEMNEDSVGSEEAPDEISDKDWNIMGAALEREFLEGE